MAPYCRYPARKRQSRPSGGPDRLSPARRGLLRAADRGRLDTQRGRSPGPRRAPASHPPGRLCGRAPRPLQRGPLDGGSARLRPRCGAKPPKRGRALGPAAPERERLGPRHDPRHGRTQATTWHPPPPLPLPDQPADDHPQRHQSHHPGANHRRPEAHRARPRGPPRHPPGRIPRPPARPPHRRHPQRPRAPLSCPSAVATASRSPR